MKNKKMLICFIVLILGLYGTPGLATDSPADYFLTCNADSLAYIYANFEDDHYIPCTLTIDGQTWSQCRVRIRGDSSRELPKKSLKVKTDGSLFPNGNDVYNFNAEWHDRSYMRVVMATRLYKKAGVPCFNAEHARLHLNGEYFGLYLNIQNMDEVFLTENGLDPLSNLYKASRDGASLTVYDDTYSRWEKKTNKEQPWDDLENLITDLDQVPDSGFELWSLQNTEDEELCSIFACNALLGSGSTYYHNYYMYHDIAGNGKWSMFPWDVDKTFSAYGLGYKYHRTSFEGWRDNPLPERWFLNPELFERFSLKINTLIESTFNTDFFYPLMDSLQAVLEASVLADPTDDVAGIDDWLEAIDQEKTIGIEGRIEQIQLQLDTSPRSFRVQPVPYALQDSIPLHWSPAVDPNAEQVFYTVRYSTDRDFPSESTISYTGIVDTTFTFPELLEEDKYFWQVLATNPSGAPLMVGYDSYNYFDIELGTVLPAVIHRDQTINTLGSPYFINEDLVINPGCELRVEPNTVIHMAAGTHIIVHGRLEIEGTLLAPVKILPQLGQDRWGAICFDVAGEPSSMRNAVIEGGSRGPDAWQRGAVSSLRTNLYMENITFDNCLQSVYVSNASLTLIDCNFLPSNLEETLMVQIGRARVDNCTFWKTNQTGDALDFDALDWGLINDCRFYGDGGGDDLIDLGSFCDSLTISNNLIVGAMDKGVSLGEGSDVRLSGNVIANCNIGVAIKDDSFCLSSNNTFFGNETAISLYEKTSGMGGGRGEVVDTIISNSSLDAVKLDPISEIEIRFSLCDSELFTGNGNIIADPLLLDPVHSNWGLMGQSPCVDAGDPSSDLDPDGTRIDMGAFFFNQAPAMLVINEINYHPAAGFDTEDWAEIYNPTNVVIDLTGWKFRDEGHSFVFPVGSFIEPFGYLIVAENVSAFLNFFSEVSPVVGDLNFGFSGSGENLTLSNPDDLVMDSVNYSDAPPWPWEPDGYGPTLELLSHDLDNNLAASWFASEGHGTPGAINGNTAVANVVPSSSILVLSAFPNPFNPACELFFSLGNEATVDLAIYDLRGRKVITLVSGQKTAGQFRVNWDGRNAEGTQLASSIYFARLIVDSKETVVKLTLVK